MPERYVQIIRAHRASRRGLVALGALSLAAIPAGIVAAQARAPAPFTIDGTGMDFATLQQAVSRIGTGSGTIRIAPGVYRQCAVQEGGDVAYVAAEPGQVVFDGVTCEGKAALVLRGRSARVTGIIFQNLRVPDGNGAGIRLEHGDLGVSQSWFRDSEEGILTGDDTAHQVLVEKSTFTRLGRCDRGLSCAHSIYTGNYGMLTVRQSRFEQGTGGHYVKSRAGHVDIEDNSFDDSHGHATNYMIDLPEGATGRISSNWFVQGQDKENYSTFIAVGAEGHTHSANGLLVEDNDARLAPGVDRNTVFVSDWTGDDITLQGNRLGIGLKARDRR
ncbi:right-handed parallel beta-helix repeat-containing protein [Novosphingobium sp. ZN18A2]|uniref:right-handed parallel beta-helix repeat-containing protein n=1 Tax=Novosphingobium sp. ZN18A2 TaxID=3079861 RepID=UPI0030CD1E51